MNLFQIPETRLVYVEDDPGVPAGQILDPFAGLPLMEGKAIGSALLKGNVASRDAIIRARNLPHSRIREAIRRASRGAPAQLRQAYARHRIALSTTINHLAAGRISLREARVRGANYTRTAYEFVREIARRASGINVLATESAIYNEEEKWFRTAVREEIGYLNRFLTDIHNGTARRINERVEAYVRALRFMYEAARVQALPDNVLLYWTGPRAENDEHVCEGCEYLMERSPYPKDSIPAVPRDGSTPCLTNCRHRIVVRVSRDLNEVIRRRVAVGTRSTLTRKLKQIKEAAGLGQPIPRVSAKERNPFQGAALTRRRFAPPRGMQRRSGRRP